MAEAENLRPENVALGKRLLEAMGPLSAVDIEQATGTPAASTRRWLRGATTADPHKLAVIADFLRVSLRWLVTGDGKKDPTGDAPDEDTVPIPLRDVQLSAGPGGSPSLSRTVGHIWLPRELVRSFGDAKQLDVVQVRGDSMSPELNDGDYVILNRNPDRIRGSQGLNEGVVATFFEDMLHIKRLRIIDARSGQMVSANSAYEPVAVPLNDEQRFRVEGRAVAKISRL